MGFSDHQAKKPDARQPPEHLAVGRIVRPHGVRGELRILALSDLFEGIEPSTTIYLGQGKIPAVVSSIRPHKEGYLLTLEGCEDRDTAEQWRGDTVYLAFTDAAALPEDTYFHWQILDLEVKTEEGEILGKVVDIIETGANDVYVVADESGSELLLPAIASVILRVDLEQSRMVVNLLPGLRTNPSI
jgi:16S rRNA processing protein RimM